MLQAAGAPLVVITLGADGALAASAERWWYQPTSERPVVDTTGCGDAFAAGFLFGWCGSMDVRRGLVYGCACGAAAVGRVGGSSPLDADSVGACMRRNEGVSREQPALWSADPVPARTHGGLHADGRVDRPAVAHTPGLETPRPAGFKAEA